MDQLAGLYYRTRGHRHRYTGASLGYQITRYRRRHFTVLFAHRELGRSPLALSIVITAVAAISILCAWARRDEITQPVRAEPRETPTNTKNGTPLPLQDQPSDLPHL